MMQATDARHAHHSGRVGLPPFENTPYGRLFVQSIMNAIFMMVLKVLWNKLRTWGSLSRIRCSSSSR
jgi:hypothetical protein